MPTTGVATQVAHPARATVRTTFALIVSVLVTLGPTLLFAWGVIRDELAKQGIPVHPMILLYVGLAVSALVAVAAIVTRLMADPRVNLLLAKIGLSALPPAAEPEDPAPLAKAAREADGYVAQHAATPVDPD